MFVTTAMSGYEIFYRMFSKISAVVMFKKLARTILEGYRERKEIWGTTNLILVVFKLLKQKIISEKSSTFTLKSGDKPLVR